MVAPNCKHHIIVLPSGVVKCAACSAIFYKPPQRRIDNNLRQRGIIK